MAYIKSYQLCISLITMMFNRNQRVTTVGTINYFQFQCLSHLCPKIYNFVYPCENEMFKNEKLKLPLRNYPFWQTSRLITKVVNLKD